MRHFAHIGIRLINLDSIRFVLHQSWGDLEIRFNGGTLLALSGEDAEKLLNILERDCVEVVNVSKPRGYFPGGEEVVLEGHSDGQHS